MAGPSVESISCTKPQTTLIYNLLNCNELCFSDFDLIVRSIHGYQVESITPCEETKTVTVVVNYHANMRNTRSRLGTAIEFISVERVNPNVRPTELSNLNKLRTRFGFGINSENEESETPKQRKKARYASKSKVNL